MTEHPSSSSSSLPPPFLSRLVAELDDETTRAIILHGSYARGDALPPYSDVDLVRITRESAERKQQKQFIWRDGYLLNLSSRPLSVYKEWVTIPQEAIFRISTIHDAHILLEKDDAFRAFQQEIVSTWTWEPLQASANAYAGRLLVELSEGILRTLAAIQFHKATMLIERILLHILPTVTEAVGVQRGILATGNSYLQQVQETIGMNSPWTQYYREAAGVGRDGDAPVSLEKRGMAALRLYQETIHLLHSHLSTEYLQTLDPLVRILDQGTNEEIP